MTTLTVHGVFLQVESTGILLTGKSNCGKSEAALMLIERGYPLIADDAVTLSRIDNETLVGHCPELIEKMLYVRGIGLLNIENVFGAHLTLNKHKLDVVVNITKEPTTLQYFEEHNKYSSFLNVKIPYFEAINNAALASRIVAICKNRQCNDPRQAFINKQYRLINRKNTYHVS